jgi:uncharacterized membrane protein
MFLNFLHKHFYGASAITLGVWEAAAYATKHKIPTVSAATCKARRRHRKLTLAAVIAWTTGLVVHLARHELSDG